MKRCVLCGQKIDSELEQYSYDQFLHEHDKEGCVYCRNCRHILRCESAHHIPKNKIVKVKVYSSDYPLDGFVLSKDGKHYVRMRNKKKGLKRGMKVGRFL